MMDKFLYEKTLFESTKNLVYRDLHGSLCNLRAAVNKGLTPAYGRCAICTQQYRKKLAPQEDIIVFSCGHFYHSSCLEDRGCAFEMKGQRQWTCFRCLSSKTKWRNITSAKRNQEQSSSKAEHSLLLELGSRKTTDNSFSLHEDKYRKQTGIFQSAGFELRLTPPPLTD
ncbi:vacuolar protein sorting-associated protein 8 homolog [Latimeria chalumnae]|uniref:vacuolar protein sorting-associated protein 8 homolog n=1 Tax=Latimeria chalumnae TaxID=7897 RepID=UPI00313ADE5D